MNTLESVEAYLATLIPRSRSFGDRLAHVADILDKLGNPQNAMPVIHIAGTSGKGSTAYYAAALLKEAGFSVGLMVSPHVSKVSERAQVNGAPLPDDVFSAYITEFKETLDAIGETGTYIEFLTCFAFWLFAKLKLDYAVIEVGLGGRLDPTNTITRPRTVRVITDIGLDHTEILGDTLDAIAAEKAGIIWHGDSVCIYPQGRLVMDSVRTQVEAQDAHFVLVEDNTTGDTPSGYQGRNWTLAQRAVIERLTLDGRPLPTDMQRKKAMLCTIPGRFEVFTNTNETIVLDAAHNPQKMTVFTKALRERYSTQPIIMVVALGKNKQLGAAEVMAAVHGVASEIVITEFTVDGDVSRGAMKVSELAAVTNSTAVQIQNPIIALKEARLRARVTGGVVAVTGSFYLISNVRDELIEEFERTK